MRLLISLTYYRPHISGLTILGQRLAEGLASRGHQVTVLTSRYDRRLPRRERLAGVEVRRMWVAARWGKGVMMPTLPAAALGEVLRCDAALIFLPSMPTQAIALSAICRLLGRPAVASFQCDLELPPVSGRRCAELAAAIGSRAACRLAQRIVTSTTDYAVTSPILGPLLDRVTAIHPPMEIPPPDPEAAAALRTRHGGGPLIGFAGRVATEKGLEHLLAALPLVRRRFPRARLLFLGDPDAAIGEKRYRNRLQPLLERCAADLEFLGTLEESELGTFYAACDVTVLPSVNRTESFGMVQVESMLSGTPVVASDLPGVRIPISATGMGRLTPAADPAALAAAICAVIANRSSFQRPRIEVTAAFPAAGALDAHETLLQRLAEPTRGRTPAAEMMAQVRQIPSFLALVRSVEAILIRRLQPLPGRLIDLGCGDGHFASRALETRAWAGVDPDLSALAEARHRGAHRFLVAARGEQLPFRDAGLETVLANSTLEHIDGLAATLAEVRRILAPEGRLVATVPSHRFAAMLLGPTVLDRLGWGRGATAWGRWFDRLSLHRNTLAPDEWRRRFESEKLTVVTWRYYLDARAHRAFELAHYLALPRLLWRRLTGRWVPWPNPLGRDLIRRWLGPRCHDAEPDGDGPYLIFTARREKG